MHGGIIVEKPTEGNEWKLQNNVENECKYFTPTADVVEVVDVGKRILLKKFEITNYWKNNVKQYRAMQGYCDIEHDTDNFLRGYNEAVEDMLAILDGKPQ
jgi:hypothetical protein